MSTNSYQPLIWLEQFLTQTISSNQELKKIQGLSSNILSQILNELSIKRFVWLNDEIYIPNKLFIEIVEPNSKEMEEYEILFNSSPFIIFLTDYINKSGYKLFSSIDIEIRKTSQINNPKIKIEFKWPLPEEIENEIVVTVDEDTKRILEVCNLSPEISRFAQLSTMNGEVYRSPYVLIKQITYLGRLRNIIDELTGEIIRRNDFIFFRTEDEFSPNESVSRQHAAIIFEQNHFFLYDTGSSNGTSIERANDTIEIPAKNLVGVRLSDGDIIRLGTALIRFELDLPISSQVNEKDLQIHTSNQTNRNFSTLRITPEQIENEVKKILESE